MFREEWKLCACRLVVSEHKSIGLLTCYEELQRTTLARYYIDTCSSIQPSVPEASTAVPAESGSPPWPEPCGTAAQPQLQTTH